MDVANQALLAESRATIFRLRHHVRELEEELKTATTQAAFWRSVARDLEAAKHTPATWVDRSVTTPALDAQIAELSAYQREN